MALYNKDYGIAHSKNIYRLSKCETPQTSKLEVEVKVKLSQS